MCYHWHEMHFIFWNHCWIHIGQLKMRPQLLCVRTCRRDMRTTAHFQQFEGVAVIGNQDLEGGVIHGRVVDLQGGQGFGVDKDHRQSGDEVRLLIRA